MATKFCLHCLRAFRPKVDFISAMALVPTDLLLNLMGVYSSLTGLLGVMANGAAIFLFARTSKVR